jgi:hypothetical protein
LAGEEADGEEGRSRLGRRLAMLKTRIPEAGVTFFGTFLLAMIIGFLLALFGMLSISIVAFFVAFVSLLSMLLKPSPKALANRAAREAPPVDEDGEEGSEEGQLVDGATTDLLVDGAPAPTSEGGGGPAPPPEPPPLEDIVVDMEDEVLENEAPAPSEESDADDVWIEG